MQNIAAGGATESKSLKPVHVAIRQKPPVRSVEAPSAPVAKPAGTLEMALFAPYNESVECIADFTDWNPVAMEKGADGWWRHDFQLADGDYLYKFRVKSLSYFAAGQTMDVFDPYALSITNDGSENTRLRVRNGRRTEIEYEWEHDDKPLPPNEDLIFYEMHVGDFLGHRNEKGEFIKGRFEDLLGKLDYLQDLGINCIELMPIKEFPGDGWGYTLRSLFAVENSYGTPEDLCKVIDECHARGIRVVIDGVYNHADSESPLTKIDYEYWYYRENPDPPELQWGPKFDFGHWDEHLKIFPARKYVIESIQAWVEQFHIDGIRFDATLAIKNFDIIRELGDAAYSKINGIKPFFTVAEHVPEDPAIAGRERGAPLDAAWHDSLAHLFQSIVIGKDRDGYKCDDVKALEQKLNPAVNGYEKAGRHVNYLVSHDHNRIMYMIGNDGKTFDAAAFRRVKLGAGLLLTSPGMPLIWMGQEFGFSADKSLEPRPLDWGLLQHDLNKGLRAYYQNLIRLRKSYKAFRGESFQTVLVDDDRKLFGFKRWGPHGSVAVVVANLRDAFAGEFVIKDAGLEDGKWREFINGYDFEMKGGEIHDSLAESEVKVFVREP